MKLEIDIPSILYNDAKENRGYISVGKMEIVWKAIADGRLIEQEPFINKPCVSSEVCEHDKNVVIDKIRAEIKTMSGDIETIADVLAIIDKYKAESEPQESEVEE